MKEPLWKDKPVMVAVLMGVVTGLVLFFGLARCRGAEIEGPEEVKAGTPAWFSLECVGVETRAIFFPSPEIQTGPPHIVPGHALFWAAKAGDYVIRAVVVDATGTITPIERSVQVVGGPEPEPEPEPDPPGKLTWSIVVEETHDRTPAHAVILTSSYVRDLFEAGKFRIVDKDNESNPALGIWIKHVPAGASLPYWFLLDDEGKILDKRPLPQTVEEVLTVIRQFAPVPPVAAPESLLEAVTPSVKPFSRARAAPLGTCPLGVCPR